MKRIVLTLVAALTLLFSAEPALARASVDAGTFLLAIDTTLPASCVGEPVRLVGEDRYHFVFVEDANGGSHLIFGAQSSLAGVGLTSGNLFASRATFTDSLQLTGGAAQVFRHTTNYRLVGRDGQVVHMLRSTEVLVAGNIVRDVSVQFFC